MRKPVCTMATALTAARVLLALPFAFLMTGGGARHATLAALVLAAAIATDVLDGALARRRDTVTAAGRAFDHAADCFFVTSGLVAGAVRGAFPRIFPILLATAFTQYVVDSYWVHGGRALRTSVLGRYKGIPYFPPLRGDILVPAALPGLPPPGPLPALVLV